RSVPARCDPGVTVIYERLPSGTANDAFSISILLIGHRVGKDTFARILKLLQLIDYMYILPEADQD
ncbi:MAG TPA: hypothetical protein PKM20_08420, partial [Nitrosomonas sp.]|nr:hypothetical protein [Nitrosomonas sp.]